MMDQLAARRPGRGTPALRPRAPTSPWSSSCRSRWPCPRRGARRCGAPSHGWSASPAPARGSPGVDPRTILRTPRVPVRWCRASADSASALARPWSSSRREKNDDPRFLRDLADVWLWATSASIPTRRSSSMAIASLCIHFQSGAALEARVRRRAVPQRDAFPSRTWPAIATFDEVYSARPGTMQNFPGVVWTTAGGGRRPPGSMPRDLEDFQTRSRRPPPVRREVPRASTTR